MLNKVKKDFWTIAILILLLEVVVMARKNYEGAAWLGLGFQTACLVFMREDIK